MSRKLSARTCVHMLTADSALGVLFSQRNFAGAGFSNMPARDARAKIVSTDNFLHDRSRSSSSRSRCANACGSDANTISLFICARAGGVQSARTVLA